MVRAVYMKSELSVLRRVMGVSWLRDDFFIHGKSHNQFECDAYISLDACRVWTD